tara:strand:- start:531 stop:1043 length:513 start_codon:yes stop_codon:yes gene_type:complete
MLRANFFLKFLKKKANNYHDIVQYNSNESLELQNQINVKILEIDKKISESSKALIEAQIVKFRSTFSKSNNFIEKIGKNVYKSKLEESINWHQEQLNYLYLSRKELEINLEKIKGTFWLNKIKRILRIIVIGFFLFFSLCIFLSSFMIIIYLMPLIILIFLIHLMFAKKY